MVASKYASHLKPFGLKEQLSVDAHTAHKAHDLGPVACIESIAQIVNQLSSNATASIIAMHSESYLQDGSAILIERVTNRQARAIRDNSAAVALLEEFSQQTFVAGQRIRMSIDRDDLGQMQQGHRTYCDLDTLSLAFLTEPVHWTPP
jgi:hypothetical protein